MVQNIEFEITHTNATAQEQGMALKEVVVNSVLREQLKHTLGQDKKTSWVNTVKDTSALFTQRLQMSQCIERGGAAVRAHLPHEGSRPLMETWSTTASVSPPICTVQQIIS